MNANAKIGNGGLWAMWSGIMTKPVWKYEELPPFRLSQVAKLDLLEASDSDLARAIWFWLRRPKLMFHDSAAVMIVALCILITLSLALVNWPGTSMSKRVAEVTIVFLEVSVEIYAIGYRLKFLRWRRDYERSIDRLIRPLNPRL